VTLGLSAAQGEVPVGVDTDREQLVDVDGALGFADLEY
jgi:hypothetical protein